MFVWKWLLGRGPDCGSWVLAKWLGVDPTTVRYLKKKLPRDEAEFEREVGRSGAPTVEALAAARVKSRSMRAKGLIRSQPRWKEIKVPWSERPREIPTKTNAVTLALDGKIPLEPPGKHRPKRIPRKKNKGCSPEQARENLKKAWANYRKPKPWRSPAESRLVKMFVWQWAALLAAGVGALARRQLHLCERSKEKAGAG
jgi:hypothetical protein